MGIIDRIKSDAGKNNTTFQTTEAETLHGILNKLFYLPKDIEEETKFVHMVMTRGAESQERVGLHASAILVPDSSFCLRQQVLSLVYRQLQGEQIKIGLMRIFEEGNAIHEKWQRLLIRGGYGKATDMDFTRYREDYMMSYTPDIICEIPEFNNGKMVGEIKSVNTFTYKNQVRHKSAWKQCQWYMHLTGIHKGFVLSEDKNTQDFKLEVYDYDPELVEPWVDRAESIMAAYDRLVHDHRMAKRPEDAKTPNCKRCKVCAMKDACWNIGMGRVKINTGSELA